MASDINSYALNVEFALVDKATPTLDAIGEKLIRMEEQVGVIANQSMVQFRDISVQIGSNLSRIAVEYNKINDVNNQMLKPIKDNQAINVDVQKRLTEETALQKNMLGGWLEIIKKLEYKQTLLDNEQKALVDEDKLTKGIDKNIGNWGGQINRANAALKSYIGSLLDVVSHMKSAAEATELFRYANMRLVGAQTQMAQHAQELALQNQVLRKDALEAYRTLANAKVPLEMLDKLTVANAQFTRISGIGVTQITAWQKALVSAGMSANEVTRYTEYMANAMRKFGLNSAEASSLIMTQEQALLRLRQVYSTPVAAEWLKASTAIAGVNKQLGLSEAQIRQFSTAMLSVDPINMRAMADSVGVSAAEMKTAEGQTKAWMLAVGQVAEQYRNIHDPIARDNAIARQFGYLGKEQVEALKAAGVNASDNTKQFRMQADYIKAGSNALQEMTIDGQNLSDVYRESNEGILAQLALLRSAFASFFGALFNAIEPALVAVAKAILWAVQGLADLVTWINSSLSALGPFGVAIKVVLGVVLGVTVAFIAFNAALSLFGGMANFASNAGRAMGAMLRYTLEGLAAGLKELAAYVPVMLSLAALILSVGVSAYLLANAVKIMAEQGWAGVGALIALTVAILALGLGLAFIGKIAQESQSGLYALAAVLVAAGVAAYLFGQAVEIVAQPGRITALVWLTAAILALALGVALAGELAEGAVPGLAALALTALALGASIALAGGGAWLFAQAVKTIAETGWMGVAVVIALSIALGVFALSLGVVGAVADAAMPGLATLALVLYGVAAVIASVGLAAIMIGAAFWLAGEGAMLFAQAMVIVVQQLSTGTTSLMSLAAGMGLMAVAILAVGAASMIVAPGLIALAVALIGVGIAAALIGVGAWLLGAAIKMIGDNGQASADAMVSLATGMAKAGIIAMFAIPGIIALAAAALVLGVALLLVGTGAWLFAQAIQGIAKYGRDGSEALGALVAPMFEFSAALIAVGAAALYAAPGLIVLAVVLAVIAVSAFTFSVAMTIAGAGALTLAMAFKSLMETAKQLDYTTGIKLIAFAAELAVAAAILTGAAGEIIIASEAMLIGAIALTVSALLFSAASALLSSATPPFVSAAQQLYESAPGFLMASIGIYVGSNLLMQGATAMGLAAIALGIAGGALWVASWATERGLLAMEKSGRLAYSVGAGFMAGGGSLYYGGLLMNASANAFSNAANSLQDAASKISSGLNAIRDLLPTFAIESEIAAIELYTTLDAITMTLENYARRMEGIAGRIAGSFRRSMPSMPMSLFGVNLIRADAIATSQPKDYAAMSREGDERQAQTRAQQAQASTLKEVNDALADIKNLLAVVSGGGPGATLVEVIALLKQWLPELGKNGDAGLQNAMTEWMK